MTTTTAPNALLVRSLTPGTGDTVTALTNLVDVHQLLAPAAVYMSRVDGHTVVDIAVMPDSSEAWRAALGAPSYTEHPTSTYPRWRTEHLWFGALIRLSYTRI